LMKAVFLRAVGAAVRVGLARLARSARLACFLRLAGFARRFVLRAGLADACVRAAALRLAAERGFGRLAAVRRRVGGDLRAMTISPFAG